MNRHPEYRYECGKTTETEWEYWISIRDKDDSGWEKVLYGFGEDDGPAELMLRIKEANGWTIVDKGMGRFSFSEDPQDLIFQWDDLFGFVIIVDDVSKVEYVKSLIERCNNISKIQTNDNLK